MSVSENKFIKSINNNSIDNIKNIFSKLLSNLCSPAFGALPKKEIEILIFDTLRDIGYLSNEPEIYEIINKLHVTQSKARNLIYESGLRSLDENALDNQLLNIFKSPSFYKENDNICIELENPLLIDRIKNIIKQKGGSATDGSFSSQIVKLKEDGFGAIIEYFSEKNGINIRKELTKAGLIDSSTKKIGKELLKFIDNAKDLSLSESFENIINIKDIFTDWIKNSVNRKK